MIKEAAERLENVRKGTRRLYARKDKKSGRKAKKLPKKIVVSWVNHVMHTLELTGKDY